MRAQVGLSVFMCFDFSPGKKGVRVRRKPLRRPDEGPPRRDTTRGNSPQMKDLSFDFHSQLVNLPLHPKRPHPRAFKEQLDQSPPNFYFRNIKGRVPYYP